MAGFHIVSDGCAKSCLLHHHEVFKMAPVSVNTLDWNDWDDTVLLQDWNEAFAEYEVRFSNSQLKVQTNWKSQKYHSIYQSGKSLEEALTREELELVTEELMG